MGQRDPRVDAYIAKAAEFARPILAHLREVVHDACPDVEEAIKWGMPFFLYKGLLCHMAAFKAHCAFGLWKGSGVVGDDRNDDAMGQFGRITTLADLPPKSKLTRLLKDAMRRNEAGGPAPSKPKSKAPRELIVPDDLAAALRANAAAKATFAKFPPGHRREYVDWITDAKTPDTRSRRLATTLEWLAEGKPRNWKYMNC